MIDVNKITSTLAKLPDAQLQQYARMHKADPYIMSLAMSESNRRKEMRAASQAPGGQAQPKVVDSEIAQMAAVDPMGNVTGYASGGYLPEDRGIAQIPAGNMNFAGGGIIAFADGGDVERYQSQGLVQNPLAQKYELESQEMGMGTRMQYSPEVRAYAQAQEQASKQGYAERERAKMLQGPYGATAPAAPVPQTAAQGAPTAAPVSTADMAARASASPYTTGLAATETAALLGRYPAAKPKAKDEGIGTPPAATARPGADLGAAAAPAQSAAQRYTAMQTEMGLGPEARTGVDKLRTEMEASKRAQAKGELEEFEKDVKTRGEAFKGREERLAKREAGLGKMKDETTGLALLEAGLGIMSTPGGLATALGKGAQAGLKTYGAGLEKLRSAQEKMDDARDQIEEFRRNEANMTSKERRQYKNNIARTETEIKQLGIEAAEKMYGYKREDAKSVFAASTQERLTDKEIGSRERIAKAQIGATLNTPDRLVFDQLIRDNKGDAVKAAEALQKMKAEKFNMYEAYSKYLAGFAGKDPMMVGAPENLTKFASRFATLAPPTAVDTSKADRS